MIRVPGVQRIAGDRVEFLPGFPDVVLVLLDVLDPAADLVHEVGSVVERKRAGCRDDVSRVDTLEPHGVAAILGLLIRRE